jgi:hypothetical protein
MQHSFAQNVELNTEEYFSWRISYTPYKIKAIQAINDYRSLANDTTLPRGRFQDDLIIIQSRISGNIEQVWYGERSKRLNIISHEKVEAVFSRSFIETILDRNKYYYLNFDAFTDKNSQQRSADYLYSTWWGSLPQNEISSDPTRLSFIIPGSDLHLETTMGDEYIGLPAWLGGFSRVGILHPNFRFGLQMPNQIGPLYGNKWALDGAWGGYGALNLESFRIGIAGAYEADHSTYYSVTNKQNIRYLGLQVYANYSPLYWNEDWGAGRLWIGVTYVRATYGSEDSSGNFIPQQTTGTTAHDIASPLIRFEYVTSANEQGYSRFETYVQIANMSATCSLALNLSKYLCIGVIGHYNFSYVENIELYQRGLYIFPIIRFRF